MEVWRSYDNNNFALFFSETRRSDVVDWIKKLLMKNATANQSVNIIQYRQLVQRSWDMRRKLE